MKKTGKKLLALLLALMMLVCAVPFSVMAEEDFELIYRDQLFNDQCFKRVIGYKGTPAGEITIPDEVDGIPVVSIEESAFKGADKITKVNIGKNVSVIHLYAFEGCTGLTSARLPKNLTEIQISAFKDCSGLTDIEIPNGVKRIDSSAFEGCEKLTDVTIPDSVNFVGFYVFNNCTGLTNVTLGNSMPRIGDSMFEGCTGLTSITVPDSVTEIMPSAFRSCTNLIDIELPDSITRIGSGAFADTAWYDAQPDGDVYIDNYYYDYKGTMPENTTVEIKDGTKVIAEGAFYGYDELVSVTIPDSITEISDAAFLGTGLRSVTIPDSVTRIGDDAFSQCADLTSVTIPDSVTSIGSFAFYLCAALADIPIPDNVTYVGFSTFGDTAWYNAQPDGDVYIGPVYYKYKGTMPENTAVEIKDGTRVIAGYAFKGCTGLISITIPESVVALCETVFNECTHLSQINWNAENVISDSVPFNRTGVDTDGVSVVFGDNVKTIPDNAFFGFKTLKSVIIGNSVTSIGDEAFSYCEQLTTLIIGNSLKSIGKEAFWQCNHLTSISLPVSTTYIGEDAFWGCRLTDIYYAGSQKQWNEIVIEPGNFLYSDPVMHFAVEDPEPEPEPEETPKSFIEKIKAFFQKIADWFKNLFNIFNG